LLESNLRGGVENRLVKEWRFSVDHIE